MKIVTISDNVQALLVDSGLFVTVQPSPQESEATEVVFDGYPSVSHYYNGTASDFATTTQNRRAITHTVEIFLVTPDSVDVEQEFRQAYEMTDKVLDIFDRSIDLSSPDLGLPRACDVLRPVPAEPMRVSTNHGDGLMVTINLVCEADISYR